MSKSNEEIEYDVLVSNVRELLKHRFGQDFVWHVLGLTGLYTETFTGDNYTYYLAGQRSIGLKVLELLEEADPSAYPRLLTTMNKRKQNRGE